MKFNKNLEFNKYIGHLTLLYGETNTKKTYFTAKFVQFLIESKNFDPKEICILDFAPPLNIINNMKIGGKIKDFYKYSIKCNNISFEGEIIPPRLNAKNKKELYDNACKNYKKTHEILNIYYENPTRVLIINDVSIYLHLGSKKFLLETIRKADTFFGNSYYGISIERSFTSLFSLKEKSFVQYLIKNLENAYITD